MDNDETQSGRRREMIAYLSTTSWSGPSVLDYCERCPINELETLVNVLKTGKGRIPLSFRWACDEDNGWLASIEDDPG